MSSNLEPSIATDLVHRIQQGDPLAEKQMIERYQRGLLCVIRQQANGDHVITGDIYQETWRIVIEKVREGAINSPDKLAAFIIQTGKNQLIMHFRRTKNTIDLEENEYDCDVDQLPPSIYERQRNGERVREVLNVLDTDRDREILTRFYLNEEEKSEICKNLKLSDLHFNRVIFRAKKRMKALINKQYDDLGS